jgi:competence protein ComEC
VSHLLAISGLHVAIVTALAVGVSAWALGRRHQLYLVTPLAAVWGYAALAGLSPSVTRAAVMVTVYLAALALGRQRSVFPALGLAGAVMAAADPRAPGTLSFQLSFAAVAGIALLGPRLMGAASAVTDRVGLGRLAAARLLVVPGRALAVSAVAVVATAPLIGGTFGEVPLWGPVATLIALPAVPLVIVFSAITAALQPVFEPLAYPAAWATWLAAGWVTLTAQAFAAAPGGVIATGGWGGGVTFAWYLAIAAVVMRGALVDTARRVGRAVGRGLAALPGRLPGRVPKWAFGAALVFAVLPWIAVRQLPDSRLTVTFHETDRGTLIVIETPGGRQALIDGGRDPGGAAEALGSALPFWDRDIDLVLLTHPDADHVGGLPAVLDRYGVATVVDSAVEGDSEISAEWQARLAARPVRTIRAVPGLVVALDREVTLEVLSAGMFDGASGTNDGSTVARLRYRDVSLLLAADITRTAEARLVSSGANLRATVLAAAHHGSDTSSSERFLRAVSPSVIVISVGTASRFGHPSPAVLARFGKLFPETPVYVTRDAGDVEIQTDGSRLWISTARGE